MLPFFYVPVSIPSKAVIHLKLDRMHPLSASAGFLTLDGDIGINGICRARWERPP
jgi:hypothetical protein